VEPTASALPVDESAPLVGTFTIQLQSQTERAAANARFSGHASDLPDLDLTVWQLADEDDASGCQLLTPHTPACTTPCDADSACVQDDTCAPYGTRHDLGQITISGISTADGQSQFVATASKPTWDYHKEASVTLAYPPAPPGNEVRLVSEGGDYSPLDISFKAIAPLELTSEEPLTLSGDVPLEVTWTADAKSDARIQVKVDISHHGGAKGKIVCDVPDTGTLSIAAKLTKGLIDLGVAGYPTIELTRVARGVGNIEPGRIEFQMISMEDLSLSIPGLTSCQADTDCPEGQVCLTTHACQ
jgi:hypothetical protein